MAIDNCGMNTDGSPPSRPKLCKSRWSGSTCNKKNCVRAHPAYCRSDSCRETWDPSCQNWHTKKKMGNAKKGATTTPSNKDKSGKANGRQQIANLERRLLTAQLATYRAKEKLDMLRRRDQPRRDQPRRERPREGQIRMEQPRSYASVVKCGVPVSTLPNIQAPGGTMAPSTTASIVELLTAVLTKLTTSQS